ncbi:MAG: LTA synthase family protein [Oscillospiraceae bacterium]|jgi:lipoteichoic acid synthase|nr:LTA synthase family protein [Oscillospiraceae bacterium]
MERNIYPDKKVVLPYFWRRLAYYAFFPLAVVWFEVALHLWTGVDSFKFGTVFFFSVASGIIFPIIGTITKKRKVNEALAVVTLSGVGIIYAVELGINNMFNSYMGVEIILGTGENAVTEFGDTIAPLVWFSIGGLITLAVPPVALGLLLKFKVLRSSPFNVRWDALCLAASVSFHWFGYASVCLQKSSIVNDREYYGAFFEFDEAAPRFGLLRSLVLDANYAMFGKPTSDSNTDNADIPTMETKATESNNIPATTVDVNGDGGTNTPSPNPITTAPPYIPQPVYNENAIYDFDAIAASSSDKNIKAIAEYLAAAPTTTQNEYTGMFKDKNLIFITAESWHTFAISEKYTPTLWKLAHNGIVLNDYYQPFWSGKTSNGEYTNLFGTFPNGTQATQNTAGHDMWYTIGNRLRNEGYKTLAFHNATYAYYSRNKTHENLGYDKFIVAVDYPDKAHNMYANYKPQRATSSDLDMMKATIPMYIEEEQFHAYYMTLSGHSPYNTAAIFYNKNKAVFKDSGYSDVLISYLAKNYELELAVTYLMQALEDSGRLDDTVIVIAPDHYPYALSYVAPSTDKNLYFKELLGMNNYTFDTDLMKTTAIIYNSQITDPIVVEKPTYSIDLMPTLLNLFGQKYDSRLYTGNDALSDAPGIVIFQDYSWISEAGYYDTSKSKNNFTPKEGAAAVDADYIKSMSAYVKGKATTAVNMQKYSFYEKLEHITGEVTIEYR